MARHRINVSLSHSGIENLISQLEAYKRELNAKCVVFVERLAEVGIRTGKMNRGDYGDLITFSKEAVMTDSGAVGRVIAYGQLVLRLRDKQLITMDPLLMAEFGSGSEAKILDEDVSGLKVGQGAFPGQTHAFDPDGWYYTDFETLETHHSYGETPTYPMYSAFIAMVFEVDKVAKEVFG